MHALHTRTIAAHVNIPLFLTASMIMWLHTQFEYRLSRQERERANKGKKKSFSFQHDTEVAAVGVKKGDV